MKKNIKAFIKEIVPIIVGILIAMYITNWNEDRKDKKYIDQMFLSINMELAETNEDITEKLVVQESLIDTANFYLKNDSTSILEIILKAEGIKIPSIKINSWKAISNSKIELIDYEKISALANIEESKEILRMKGEYLLNFIYPNIKDTGIDKKELLILLIRDITVTEKMIQNEIAKL
ncbi:hypothetical protein [Zobellia nedashkovskayae]|uniref:hypothetical protein n=1 Tax=Zobellia nedashkovskayae TaxID=2779510 RepID=UPI00188ACDED|nr:hypothetical protein [Zobellia nedashkovskayae]